MVISPWAKPGYVDSTQYEFASMIKLADTIFNVQTPAYRVNISSDMMNSFDFAQAPLPPLIEPTTFVGPSNGTTPPPPPGTVYVQGSPWPLLLATAVAVVGLFYVMLQASKGRAEDIASSGSGEDGGIETPVGRALPWPRLTGFG
jgi:hypothetical protein